MQLTVAKIFRTSNKCYHHSEFAQNNTSHYGSHAKRCLEQQASIWYRLLTVGQNIGSDPSIRFFVTSRLLTSKEHKINKSTFNG